MYRLFLIGTHDENLTYFIDWNKDLVDLINVQSYTEPLNGVLCVYEYYFIHVLEVNVHVKLFKLTNQVIVEHF